MPRLSHACGSTVQKALFAFAVHLHARPPQATTRATSKLRGTPASTRDPKRKLIRVTGLGVTDRRATFVQTASQGRRQQGKRNRFPILNSLQSTAPRNQQICQTVSTLEVLTVRVEVGCLIGGARICQRLIRCSISFVNLEVVISW